MKKSYVTPVAEVISTMVEHHLCDASKGNYSLGSDTSPNKEEGPINTGGDGLPNVNSAKKHNTWSDWEDSWED
jgi:hypothetical protein